jgi:CHAD domain-containing protein
MGDRDNLLRARLDAALRKTWSSLETLIAQAREAPETTALHAVRIGAKKVRYLVEVIHELHVPGSDRALSYLRHLQQHLGDWHDLQVLEEVMLEMVARPRFLQEHLELAMEVERLALRNRQRKRIHEERLFQMTGNSEEWKRLTEWVEGLLSDGSLPAGGEAGELHSPALPLKA